MSSETTLCLWSVIPLLTNFPLDSNLGECVDFFLYSPPKDPPLLSVQGSVSPQLREICPALPCITFGCLSSQGLVLRSKSLWEWNQKDPVPFSVTCIFTWASVTEGLNEVSSRKVAEAGIPDQKQT